MKANTMLPHQFQIPGWILLILGLILGGAALWGSWEPAWLSCRVPALHADGLFTGTDPSPWFKWVETNLIDELAAGLLILGGLGLMFSRERQEDEYMSRLRLEALLRAALIQQLLLLLAVLFIYQFSFLTIMTLNLFTLPLVFIGLFRLRLWQARQAAAHEE